MTTTDNTDLVYCLKCKVKTDHAELGVLTKVAAVESAYAGRQQRCATPRCTNLASACCLGYCWTCSAKREANWRGR